METCIIACGQQIVVEGQNGIFIIYLHSIILLLQIVAEVLSMRIERQYSRSTYMHVDLVSNFHVVNNASEDLAIWIVQV